MPWCQDISREQLVKLVPDLPRSDDEAWKLMLELGYNRRMRKRLMNKDWVIKFYGGKRTQSDKIFKPVESNHTVVLDIDVMRDSQWDMLKDGNSIYKMMLWGCSYWSYRRNHGSTSQHEVL